VAEALFVCGRLKVLLSNNTLDLAGWQRLAIDLVKNCKGTYCFVRVYVNGAARGGGIDLISIRTSSGDFVYCLAVSRPLLETGRMRWRGGPIRKRHVPEPERLRDRAANLKGKADALLREADALLAEAEALDAAKAEEQKTTVSKLTHDRRLDAEAPGDAER
jgi:hypothetical protein